MLTLSRSKDEKIVIGNDIEIVVVHIGGGRVTLAIQAPPHVKILRGELIPKEPDWFFDDKGKQVQQRGDW